LNKLDPAVKTEKKIVRLTGRAIHDFGMIVEGDRVLVALSGGKDSWTLLHALEQLRVKAPVRFELTAVTVDPGFPAFETRPIADYCAAHGYRHFVEPSTLYEIVESKRTPGSSYCAFCARLRRGILYGVAQREGFTKIALGHHADDFIETLLMAEFFTGEIKAMAPVLHADDGANVVIRPLCYVAEDLIRDHALRAEFPVVCCGCPVCGAPDQQRKRIKRLLRELEDEHPGIKANLLSSLGRVRLRHLMVRPETETVEEVTASRNRSALASSNAD
jgi:tRNA 2-thiocytidine biosynthesis protein TtcA